MTSALDNTQKDYAVGGFTSVFSGHEEFLKDHIVQGEKILPAAAYLEMARAAVESSLNLGSEVIVVLSESVFVFPLAVTKSSSVDIRVYPMSQLEFGVEVSSEQGVHFQTKACVKKQTSFDVDTSSAAHTDFVSFKNNCEPWKLDRHDFYAKYELLGMRYGPSHRGVEYVKYGDNYALAHVLLPGASVKGMKLNPGMLDSVIQCTNVFALESKEIYLPFIIKKVEVYGSLPDSVYVYLSNTENGINISVTDEDGNLKVAITGFEARALNAKASVYQAVGYQPKWQIERNIQSGPENETMLSVVEPQGNYTDLVKKVLTIAKKLIEEKTEGHTIEVRLSSDQILWRGIIGALKTVSLEYSKINFRMRVNGELFKLGYEPFNLSRSNINWPDNKTILISGGLGGLGKLIARDIAEKSHGCTIILVGRGELSTRQKSWIDDLEKLPVNIVYVCCDITVKVDVESLIQRYPNIDGVIHAAGIVKDALITQKKLDEIDDVLAPKVHGIENLDQATKALKLDYFIAFSSVSGSLGNIGQIDYAAANGYMDEFIQARAERVKEGACFGRCISINWPLWESDGMQVSQGVLHHMRQVLNISPLPAELGLDLLRGVIASAQTQLLILFGNPASMVKMISDIKVSKLQEVTGLAKQESRKNDALEKEILRELTIQAAKLLKLDPSLLGEDMDWREFGFDSILVTSFVNQLNSEYDLNLMPSILFEATNLLLFSRYMVKNHAAEMAKILSVNEAPHNIDKRSQNPIVKPVVDQPSLEITAFEKRCRSEFHRSSKYRASDIAIIGMSCRVAGASDVDAFWDLLANEKDMISEIPFERWDWRDHPDSVKWGSFIENVAEFDPLFFGISPAEAFHMVPEQRLMMESVWDCLENAGCGGEETKGTNTGIFVASITSGYTTLLNRESLQAYSSTGMVPSIGPNRISHLMDWSGPSEPVETACSSSLVAVHRAVEAIRLGHCKQAIAGGINLLLTPDPYISFTKSGMLCADGRCKTFSDKANGYVRGEGLGMLMLKPLGDAMKDGNMIHAVIKGTAVNHGGHSHSLTAPNPKSQAAVIANAISDAGINFDGISYIECHGTGTELGDAVEIDGLKMVALQMGRKEYEQKCVLGSVKSNIGHLEMAAGVIGLIKVVMQMQHKKIAKSLHCEAINPYVNLGDSPYVIAQSAREWEASDGHPRIAGVSSFGFGGVNAHVILEEFSASDRYQQTTDDFDNISQLLVISARDEKSLFDYVARYSDFVSGLPNDSNILKRIAFTMQTGRAEMDERVVFVADSVAEWATQLEVFLKEKGKTNHRNIYRGSLKGGNNNYIDIGDSQIGREYIRRLAESGESRKLAELWVKGSKIHWRSLYQ